MGFCLGLSVEAEAAQKFHLIYSNGMKNTVQDAQHSAQILKKRLLDKLKKLKRGEVSLWKEVDSSVAYNFDDTIAREVKEVYEQKKSERDRLFWEWYQTSVDVDETFKRMVYEEMSQCRLEHRIDETLWHHRELYLQQLKDGFDLMVVAHSQGNLFANALYDRIQLDDAMSAKRVHLVAVATPASVVGGNGPHVTLKSDGVINSLLPYLLSEGLLKPLDPNVENKIPKPGFMDHEFVKHYLLGDQSGAKIIEAVMTKILRKNKQLPK